MKRHDEPTNTLPGVGTFTVKFATLVRIPLRRASEGEKRREQGGNKIRMQPTWHVLDSYLAYGQALRNFRNADRDRAGLDSEARTPALPS